MHATTFTGSLGKSAVRQQAMKEIETLKGMSMSVFHCIVNNVGPIVEWPAHQLQKVMSKHLAFGERWSLSIFLLMNTCPPESMRVWYEIRGMLHDDSARKHINDIIAKHKSGAFNDAIGQGVYILPCRATSKLQITPSEQKAMFAQKKPGQLVPHTYGNPATSFVFPLASPNPDVVGHEHWPTAATVMHKNPATNEVKIVPHDDDPDSEHEEAPMYREWYQKPEEVGMTIGRPDDILGDVGAILEQFKDEDLFEFERACKMPKLTPPHNFSTATIEEMKTKMNTTRLAGSPLAAVDMPKKLTWDELVDAEKAKSCYFS